jgi:uncharacterized membrane protein YjjP (DUF1212 family)
MSRTVDERASGGRVSARSEPVRSARAGSDQFLGDQANGSGEPPTTSGERCKLVLAFARTLFVNGQATNQTLAAAECLGRTLGLRTNVMARWGELQLKFDSKDSTLISQVAADPTGVDMNRVASTMRAMANIESGRLSLNGAMKAISVISRAPPAPTWLFALAAAACAVALSVIFGVEHIPPMVLIFVSAGAGAILRRAVAKLSVNDFVQPFCAATLAGLIGALAVRYDLSSSLRLVAVCPCMILVPGPHFLNGTLDLISGRIHLGAARLVYAGFIVLAISTGLLLGLALLGTSLPVDPPGRIVPLWQDVIAAGIAVSSYSIFFSTPLNMLPWPVAVGMLAHAMRWVALSVFGFGLAAGALVACIIVGLILTPVSRRSHMPFAAIGFASVVSMMPGIYIFRMMSGLVQIAGGTETTLSLIQSTISAGMNASVIILAIGLGLTVPKMILDHLSNRSIDANENPRSG